MIATHDPEEISSGTPRVFHRKHICERPKAFRMQEPFCFYTFSVVSAIDCYQCSHRNTSNPFCFHTFFVVSAIDCYQCSSRNFSDPFCHDPFHPAYKNLTTDCGEGRESRVGLFPARYCTKIVGNNCKCRKPPPSPLNLLNVDRGFFVTKSLEDWVIYWMYIHVW